MPQSGQQRGLFITLEGIEGAGKSTQQEYIARLLIQRGHRVVQTREPGGTALGEAIRSTLLAHTGNHAISHDTELLLMFAARCQHVDEIIRPNIEAGITVLSDRFTDSSFAYQGGGRGIAAGRIRSLQQWVHPDLNPDLTLLLDLPVATGLERVGRRGE
jgi:dTMP kinase